MIVRQADGDTLMDASSLSRITKRQRATIRAYSTPVACDVRSRRTLYNALDTIDAVAKIATRTRQLCAA